MKIDIISKGQYKLLEDLVYRDITVPEGFEWDGASVPLLVTPIVPRSYGTMRASCFHDYLCSKAKNKHQRKYADKVWKWILEEDGYDGLRLKAAHFGVRIGAFFGIGNRF